MKSRWSGPGVEDGVRGSRGQASELGAATAMFERVEIRGVESFVGCACTRARTRALLGDFARACELGIRSQEVDCPQPVASQAP